MGASPLLIPIDPWFPEFNAVARLQNGEDIMSAIGFQARLSEASSAEGVAGICRDYLASLTPAAIGELPESCLPTPHMREEDISPYALRLIRRLGIGDRASAPVLHEITTFFTKAALRLTHISIQVAAVTAERRESRSE